MVNRYDYAIGCARLRLRNILRLLPFAAAGTLANHCGYYAARKAPRAVRRAAGEAHIGNPPTAAG